MGGSATLSGAGSGAAAGSALGPWGAAGGAVLGGLAGFLGDEGGDQEKMYQDYLNQLQAITLPSLDELISAGNISGTAYDQISEDPATRRATMDALQALKAEGEAGGASVQSRAAMDQLTNTARQDARMRNAAVMDEMQRRGMAGGGSELAARMMANQGAAQREHLGGVQAAADDRSRALAAMVQAGNLGTQVRGQDWSQEAQKASARDALNQWNAANATNAYGNRTNWQLAKSQAQAPAYAGMAQGAQQNRQNAIDTANAAGSLAGGAIGYAAGEKKIKGYDANGSPIYG
jgi:hypothetical protein